MNYYSHHIGDFDKATRHLSRIERSIYRDLIELYYDTEEQLPLDINWLCRRIIARSNEESTAVEQVLNEFFIKTPNGWYHDRCEEELDAFRLSNTQKSIAGKASAAKRTLKRQQALNGISTGVERALNERTTARQQNSNGTSTELQLTNNQEPLTNHHKPVNQPAEDLVNQLVPKKTEEISPAVSLSIAFRAKGIKTQPADPRLIALAAQGVTVDLINSACDEAKECKPNEIIGLAYVLAILERWAKSAKDLQANGAQKPKSNAAWWASDSSIIAKGVELRMSPNAGERMPDFKARIQAAIDNGGKPPLAKLSTVIKIAPYESKMPKPMHIPQLTSLVKNRDPP